MRTEPIEPEPQKKWIRKNYDLTFLHGKTYEQRAEIETTRDLNKPIEQLVCDFHDIAEIALVKDAPKPPDMDILLIQAEKRMVSLMGRVAIEHKRSSDWLVRLTWVLGILTVGILLGTLVLIGIALHTDSQIEQINRTTQEQWHQKEQTNASAGQINGVGGSPVRQ